MDNGKGDKSADIRDFLSRVEAELVLEPAAGPGRPALERMADRIEHTLLRAGSGDDDLRRLCAEARGGGFRAVCVLPRDVEAARELLGGSRVLLVTVAGFPLAGLPAGLVADEARALVASGADEIDMVIDVSALRRGDARAARDGVARVVDAASGRPVKVILETGLLDRLQIAAGCAAARSGGAAFVKTSTGFGPRGASLEDVELMRACVGQRMGIKAAGGIRERGFAERLVAAGADLIGTSSGPALVG